MELSAKYAYKVWCEKSFSAAAKALFISQPALSASVSHLEKELGFRIFDRSVIPLSLTPEGRIYIDTLEEMMACESHMRHRLRQLSSLTYGSLSIGGSSSIVYRLFPILCGEFHRRYPEIHVRLDMGGVGNQSYLYDELKAQRLDFVFGYDFEPKEHAATPLLEEHLIIAMPRAMAEEHGLSAYSVTREELLSHTYSPEKELDDLSIFRPVHFLRYKKGGNTHRKMEEMLGEYTSAPYTIENARNLQMHYSMMCEGIGAVVTTDSVIATTSSGGREIRFFVPSSPEARRMLYLIRKTGSTTNPIADRFLDVAVELCASGAVRSRS